MGDLVSVFLFRDPGVLRKITLVSITQIVRILPKSLLSSYVGFTG